MLTMEASPPFGAVDLGSNSFHMIIGRFRLGKLEVLARNRDMIQLGSGLDKANMLSKEAMRRGFACLKDFKEIIDQHDLEGLRVVGTATLRKAENGLEFTKEAEGILGSPVEIISGIEEANLIYNGVFNSNDVGDEESMLVVDIGGRSTEIIVGSGQIVENAASVDLGCISVTKGIFPDQRIVAEDIVAGQDFIKGELEKARETVPDVPARVFGASGTVKAIAKVVNTCAWSRNGYISRDSLDRLFSTISAATRFKQLDFGSLPKKRIDVFPGGIILLREIFRSLNIEEMEVSQGALREGVLFDLLARFKETV